MDTSARRGVDLELVFVAFVFGLALGIACWFVAAHGTRLAMLDDLTQIWGQLQPSTPWAWFWEQHTEHRVALPRFLHWVCLRATRDFRTATWIDLALLAGAALACVAAARRMRGRPRAVDAVFPLVFFSLAASENLLNGFQICFVLPVAVVAVVLASIAASGAAMRPGTAWTIAVGLAVLPLCGVFGVLQVAFFAPWLAWVGWRAWRRGDRRVARIALAGAFTGSAIAALTFVDFHLLPGFQGPTIARTLTVAAQFLAANALHLSESQWPWSGILAGAALLGCTAWLVFAAIRDAQARERATGLLAAGCALAVVAIAIGYGRAADHDFAGFASRYATLAALLSCLVFFAAAVRGPSRWAGAVQVLVFLAAAWAWVANLEPALDYGRTRSKLAMQAQIGVDEGLSYTEIAKPGVPEVYYGVPPYTWTLHALDRLGLAPFERPRGPDAMLLLGQDPVEDLFHRPDVVRAPIPPRERAEADRIVLAADVRTELECAVPPGARTLRGWFGVPEHIWKRGLGDDTRFEVEVFGPDGELLARAEQVLSPVSREEDRGFHDFGLRLPETEGARLVLRSSSPQPEGSRASWVMWSDVRAR